MSSFDDHANFSYSLVATAPSPAASGTSLDVTAGTGSRFPTPPFNATVWPTGVLAIPTNAEIVRVTAITTDTLTITRAQESSSARSIIAGDQIAATITDKVLTDIEVVAAAAPGFDATVPVTQAFSDVAATGAAVTAARRDHVHGMPASPSVTGLAVVASDTSVAEVAATGTETTLFTYSVPGGTLGTSGQLVLFFIGDLLQNSGSLWTFTLRVKYGGTVVGFALTGALPANAGRRAFAGTLQLAAAGATNAQRSGFHATIGAPSSAAAPPTASGFESTTVPGQFASANTGLAIDSTAAQALDLTGQWAAADASTSFKLHAVLVLKG